MYCIVFYITKFDSVIFKGFTLFLHKFFRFVRRFDKHFVAFQLKSLSFEELSGRMTNLDTEMEKEIEELRSRYLAKRQPILEAMDAKKRRQQNF